MHATGGRSARTQISAGCALDVFVTSEQFIATLSHGDFMTQLMYYVSRTYASDKINYASFV